jgi:hypothetical protein
LICHICDRHIRPGDDVEYHHPVYRSAGGVETEPTHKACHRRLHSERGDFAAFGRLGGLLTAQTRVWAFNLKNVRNHPAYEFDRHYYLMLYAQ